MNTRKPIYSSDVMSRVISGPNGIWLYQKKVAEKGTREVDCWSTEIEFDNLVKANGMLK